jgi:hypothetical protein
MQTNDETVAQLKKKEKALRGEASKLQKGTQLLLRGSWRALPEQDQERTDIQELTFKVKQLQEKEALVPQQVEANRKQLQRELAVYDRLAQDVADLEKQRKHKLEEVSNTSSCSSAAHLIPQLRRGATFYSERLGLKFERLVDVSGHHLRFCFVHIDRKRPRLWRCHAYAMQGRILCASLASMWRSRASCTLVRSPFLRTGAFSVRWLARLLVTECEPALPSLPGLVAELNATNDLGTFVRQVRKAFRQTIHS